MYFEPDRDEFGRVKLPTPPATPASPKQLFWSWGEFQRLKPYMIERLWKARNASNADPVE